MHNAPHTYTMFTYPAGYFPDFMMLVLLLCWMLLWCAFLFTLWLSPLVKTSTWFYRQQLYVQSVAHKCGMQAERGWSQTHSNAVCRLPHFTCLYFHTGPDWKVQDYRFRQKNISNILTTHLTSNSKTWFNSQLCCYFFNF